jgi:hypothetical protein
MGTKFSGQYVVNSYINIENMLEKVLQFIPYCEEHEKVWSPQLTTIMFEACSQLDSLWKYQASQSPHINKKSLSIIDYFTYFGQSVNKKWVVFWGEQPEIITPFKKWQNCNKYEILDWWNAYNKLKHDRILNRSKATLQYTLESIAGLFVAILKCEYCKEGILQAGWLSGNQGNLLPSLDEDSSSVYLNYCVAESRLFARLIGWDNIEVDSNWHWYGPASPRFINWFDQYYTTK